MRFLYWSALLIIILAFSAACGPCSGRGQSTIDLENVDEIPLTPTITEEDEGTDIFWGHVHDTIPLIEKAWKEAKQMHPNYKTNQADADGLSEAFDAGSTNFIGALDKRVPPPGLETQFAALKTKVRAFIDAIHASPANGSAIEAAYNDYVTACQSVQQFADSSGAGVDLQCGGISTPLSAGAFFAAVAPIIATMHTNADAAQAAFDALSPAQQADAVALTLYGGGVGNPYGKAAQSASILPPPATLAPLQQSFVDAANAVFDAGQQVEFDVKSITDPAGLPDVVTKAKATLPPLEVAVEAACGQLQTAATAAGVMTSLGCRS